MLAISSTPPETKKMATQHQTKKIDCFQCPVGKVSRNFHHQHSRINWDRLTLGEKSHSFTRFQRSAERSNRGDCHHRCLALCGLTTDPTILCRHQSSGHECRRGQCAGPRPSPPASRLPRGRNKRRVSASSSCQNNRRASSLRRYFAQACPGSSRTGSDG